MVDEHARAGPPRPVRAFEGAAAHARHAGHSPGAARPARRSLDAPRHTSQHAADAHGGGGIPASGSNRGSGSRCVLLGAKRTHVGRRATASR